MNFLKNIWQALFGKKETNESCSKTPIKPKQMTMADRVLAALYLYGKQTSKGLALHLGANENTVRNALAILRSEGLVTLEGKDGRYFIFAVSPNWSPRHE
ncbi:hypothetical protein [Comamonas sp. 4034]|uniref:hypothetical protein n=1 Tax=Comamonas sp. 4034 TaxID=3156455 RepID=UPI003D256D36